MIGYFFKAGDPQVASMFLPYIGGPSGLGTLLEPLMHKNYGDALTLLLIQYYVEGKFQINLPDHLKVRNYSTKNRDIAVVIPVTRSVFHEASEEQRREFLLRSTLDAISAVRARLEKRKVNVDFYRLVKDVEEIGKVFISSRPA
ncbi:MAG: hypothetical protein M1434_00880 [Chloroflexi bacterium]|nr:hypothetical protein [Chloroflexota bacterium]MCL5273287.1 hypothetical protein [Chloroflexota bacterium]